MGIEAVLQELSPEGQTIEYKKVIPPPNSIARYISAFANTEGGRLICGVTDELEPIGISDDTPAISMVEAALTILNPRPNVRYDFSSYRGRRVFVIDVDKYKSIEGNEVRTIEGLSYTRTGDSVEDPEWNAHITVADKQISELLSKLNSSRGHSTEARIQFMDQYGGLLGMLGAADTFLLPGSLTKMNAELARKVLSRLVLSSMVDTFELYLRNLMFEIYLKKPATLKVNMKIQIDEVLSYYERMNEFLIFVANLKLGNLSRGKLSTFIESFHDDYGLTVFTESQAQEAEYYFSVRHLYTHNNGRVDGKFLQNPHTETLKQGDEHKMTLEQLHEVAMFFIDTVDRLDTTAINNYDLSTRTN